MSVHFPLSEIKEDKNMANWALVEKEEGDVLGNVIAIFDTKEGAMAAKQEEEDAISFLGLKVKHIVRPVNFEGV
jgi:hypothetical protein